MLLPEFVQKIITKESTHMSTRDAFGFALELFGEKDNRIVVIDGDLSRSTRTYHFATSYPERFFNVGIAEQNMISIGAGLASCGKIPVVVTYATFLVGRGLDQIRNMVAYSDLNVKLIGTHAGLATGEDGGTHQALEDIGVMRGIPQMKVFSPADAVETILVLHYALTVKGPVYIRLSREKGRILHARDYQFNPLKGEVLYDFSGKKIALVATGTMVSRALEVAGLLEAQGVSAGVINIHTIKPFDKELIQKVAKEVELIVTIEDHNVIGGLGTTVADTLASCKGSVPLQKIGVEDVFGQSGAQEKLYLKHQLTPDQILIKILSTLELT